MKTQKKGRLPHNRSAAIDARDAAIVARVKQVGNFTHVAAEFGLGRERVSQIYKAATGELRDRHADSPTAPCACGCGAAVRVRDNKGRSVKYVWGHQNRGEANNMWRGGRVDASGYRALRAEGHARATPGGKYVKEHILVVERAMGKPLPAGAVVHHVNGNKSDNRPSNLVVCQDNAYHQLIHARQRAYDACGNPDWRRCWLCRAYDSLNNLTPVPHAHPSCRRLYDRHRAQGMGRRGPEVYRA